MQPDIPKPAKARRPVSDVLILFGAGALLAVLLVGGFLLSDRLKIGEFWVWGTWVGPFPFIAGARYLRRRFRQRGFLYYCVGWFPAHMAVMYSAAARLPIFIALLPVALELFTGFTIAYWLFGPPAGARKLSGLFGR